MPAIATQSDEARSPPASVVPPRSRPPWPLVVLAVLAILAAMYFARDILVPIVFAVLLALLLRPLQRRMKRLRVPDLASALVLVGGVAIVFVVGVLALAGQAQYWLAHAPATVAKVRQMIPSKSGPVDDLQKTSAAVQELTNSQSAGEQPLTVQVQSADLAYSVLGVSGHFVGAAVIAFVLAYFILGLSDTLIRQALATRGTFPEKRNIVELVYEVEGGISRYLMTITLINVCLGIATAAAMWLLGIPNPILWGVLIAMLNFVPHVGAFLCMVVLFFVGTVTHQSMLHGLLVAGVFVLLTSAESYFLTPFVLSKSLRLSPLAVILAILFWGWLWGIAGGLMAAPLLTVIKLICDQFEATRPYSALLAGEVPSSAEAPRPNELAASTSAAA